MELIKDQTAPAVWLAAVEHLNGCPDGEDFDVFLHVAEPTVLSKQDAAVYNEVDAFLKARGAFPVHTVAETIFPLDEYLRGGARGVFDDFPPKIRAIQKARDDGNWGSYALRIRSGNSIFRWCSSRLPRRWGSACQRRFAVSW
jgi:hypothetical protein